MSELKTAGVTVDNWKVEKYIKALEKAGYTNYTLVPFPIIGNCTIIKVKTEEKNFLDIMKLCKKMELDLKNSN